MCLKGHLDVAELLLDRGADVGQANTYGVTALMAACQEGHRDVAALLLDRGADVGQANRGVDGPDVGLSGGADVEAPVQVRGSATAGEKWDFISETVVVHSSNRVPAPRKRAPSGRASRVATVTHTHRVRTHSALPNAHGRCVFSTLKRACAPHARLALLFSFVFHVVLEPTPPPFRLAPCAPRMSHALVWRACLAWSLCPFNTQANMRAPVPYDARERSQARAFAGATYSKLWTLVRSGPPCLPSPRAPRAPRALLGARSGARFVRIVR